MNKDNVEATAKIIDTYQLQVDKTALNGYKDKYDHKNMAKVLFCLYMEEKNEVRMLVESFDANIIEHFDENLPDIPDRINLIRDMSFRLKYLHDMGVIHQDICPENVMISCLNNNYICKLTDGNLRQVIGVLPKTPFSALGSNQEPNYYRSPEFWDAPVLIDKEYDIFRMALVFLAVIQKDAQVEVFKPQIEGKLRNKRDMLKPIGQLLHIEGSFKVSTGANIYILSNNLRGRHVSNKIQHILYVLFECKPNIKFFIIRIMILIKYNFSGIPYEH